MLEILYQDEYIIAINKPSGLLVHKSFYARDASVFAVQELRNQIGGQHVYPIQRLDRKTSGVLLFALDKESLKIMNDRFATREVAKFRFDVLHFRHIFHPILGSRPHGCNKQNKLWLENFGLKGMMLHAHELVFNHPITNEQLVLNAKVNEEFSKVGDILGLDLEKYK